MVFEELDLALFASVCCVVVSGVVADVDWMELLTLEICVVCICDVNLRSVTIASVERRGKTVNKGVELIGAERASLAPVVVVLDIRVVAFVAFLDDASVEVVVGSCVLTSTVLGRETVVGIDVDRVATDTDVEMVVGNCVLPSAVVDNDTVVGADVDCVVIEADVVGFLVVERSVVAATVVDCAVDICTEDNRKQQDFSLLYNTIISTSSYQ